METQLRDLGNRVAADGVVAVVLAVAALLAHHRYLDNPVDSVDFAFLLWSLTAAVLARGLFYLARFLVVLYQSA
jgi:hypothetical protein